MSNCIIRPYAEFIFNVMLIGKWSPCLYLCDSSHKYFCLCWFLELEAVFFVLSRCQCVVCVFFLFFPPWIWSLCFFFSSVDLILRPSCGKEFLVNCILHLTPLFRFWISDSSLTSQVMSEASLRFSLNERSTEAASFLSYKNKKGLNIEIPCDIWFITMQKRIYPWPKFRELTVLEKREDLFCIA